LKNKLIGCFLLCFFTFWGKTQTSLPTNTSPYTLYKDKVIFYSDLGFSSSPYSMHFKSNETEITKLKYKNNLGVIMGLGGSYKWFSIRLAFALKKNFFPIEARGKTKYIDLGFDFTLKKMYVEFDFRNYKGYALKNASAWNTALNGSYEMHPEASTLSLVLNGWYFHNKDFKMHSMKGRIGHYNKEVFTWYLKNTLNIQGVSDVGSIIPLTLTDTLNSKNRATTISAFDFGSIPGVAYVNRKNNWQFGGMLGFGPVIQSKFYIVNETTRGFLGLAPRYDIRFIAGYNVPRWFAMISTEFDNKSIRFNDLIYRNSKYTIKLMAGIRLQKKKQTILNIEK
jgi:hypothetical protein